MCACVRVCRCVCARARARVRVCLCVCTCARVCACVFACARVGAYVRARVMSVRVCVHACVWGVRALACVRVPREDVGRQIEQHVGFGFAVPHVRRVCTPPRTRWAATCCGVSCATVAAPCQRVARRVDRVARRCSSASVEHAALLQHTATCCRVQSRRAGKLQYSTPCCTGNHAACTGGCCLCALRMHRSAVQALRPSLAGNFRRQLPSAGFDGRTLRDQSPPPPPLHTEPSGKRARSFRDQPRPSHRGDPRARAQRQCHARRLRARRSQSAKTAGTASSSARSGRLRERPPPRSETGARTRLTQDRGCQL